MKMRTIDASRRLGMHPAALLHRVAELAPEMAFSDVWPEIEEHWIETLSAIHHVPRQAEAPAAAEHDDRATLSRGLSEHAVHVLDKLHRQRKYGNVSVALDALMNLTHVPKRDLEDVIAELRSLDLLAHDGAHRDTISLNPARRIEIEAIANNR